MQQRFAPSFLLVFLALASSALASTTWFVDGVNGNDSNNCMSSTTACKTISHAISLITSGDTIMVAAATYTENLSMTDLSVNMIGAGASTTIIDGGGKNVVIVVSQFKEQPFVLLKGLTIRNGTIGVFTYPRTRVTVANSVITGNHGQVTGAGIDAFGAVGLFDSVVSGNTAVGSGGGIQLNSGSLVINRSTISGNTAVTGGGGIECGGGSLSIYNSTINGNSVSAGTGGGIEGGCSNSMTITNSTISGNTATAGKFGGGQGGGIFFGPSKTLSINSSTIANNSANAIGANGGGIYIYTHNGIATAVDIQNSIVANNSTGNCAAADVGTFVSNGYNLSSDNTCNFSSAGDLNNTDPKLGPLQNNGGPTQTMALTTGSPAIDAGNPGGCRGRQGNLLKFDQRGDKRPDAEDTAGCDIGAYESQHD